MRDSVAKKQVQVQEQKAKRQASGIEPGEIIEKKGTQVTVRMASGGEYKRNISHVKKYLTSVPQDSKGKVKDFIMLKILTTYHPEINKIHNILKKNWTILLSTKTMQTRPSRPNKTISTPDEADTTFKKFQPPSTWCPSDDPQSEVSLFIKNCKQDIGDLSSLQPLRSHNISREERRTLNTLRNRKDIVIKPADKGGAVVVWRKDLYIAEVEE
ncbi:hypothetical protein CAPTEDRAFT_212262 [Capitella teleta]|uniref:Uncharacterized protein n=1 Tax=Capitella teleta TaxID=283909 RepID=R7T6J2_CAPTE|nr:hypothetical protein CAPTEDRAFT_212262 [Capitella teleta]|eukprot:ELT89189.1 hypothetical protein CAPTEDRAFT_212262 [Capitella teleta]